jgi:hypothetical protein
VAFHGTRGLYGQPVAGFALTLAPRLLERGSLLNPNVRKILARVHAPASASAQVFIAADGLPVRSAITLRVGAATIHLDLDIPAIEFPLTVLAPPAAETISAAELEALERDHSFG